MQTTLIGRPTTMLEEDQLSQEFESPILHIEYNTDTSAQLHRNMDEDIVRHFNEKEVEEAQDKEPEI